MDFTRKSLMGKITFHKLRSCPVCKCVWTLRPYNYIARLRNMSIDQVFEIYEDFPSYGKEKEKCPYHSKKKMMDFIVPLVEHNINKRKKEEQEYENNKTYQG